MKKAYRKDKVLLGAHMSISGGVEKAVLRGKKIGCNTIQIFTSNNLQWKSEPLLKNNVERFINLAKESNIKPIFAHSSYLMNLLSSDKIKYRKSYNYFIDEINRCEILKIPYLVIHPGSSPEVGEGIDKISNAFNEILSEKNRVTICIETTAGQGNNIGYRFEHLAKIIEKTDNYLGVCLDTCHIFAAGYDIRDNRKYNKTFKEFDRIIGIDRVKIIHINDSKKELGSRVDRHEHIGKGCIGLKGFELLMNDEKLKGIPKILETPKGPDMKEDIENIKILKGLIK